MTHSRMRTAAFLLSIGSLLHGVASVGAADWQLGPDLPTAPQPRLYAAGLNVDGTIYVIGGSPFASPPSNDAFVHYLPAGASTWQTGTPVEGPVVRQGAGIDDLGQIVVFGGVDGLDPEGDIGQVYVYDAVEGQYQGLADRTDDAPSDFFAWATDSAGRIYSIGGGPGEFATAGNPNSAHVERYIGSTDTWQVVAPMPMAVADACAVNDGTGRLLVFGGIDAHASTRLAEVLAYDVALNTWSTTAVPDLPVATSGARAVRGADDRIYLIGGVTGPIGSGVTQSTVWVLDLATGQWSPGPGLASPRSHFAAALGNNDLVYAIGGSNASGGVATVETLYTPRCPAFTRQPESRDPWTGQLLTLAATVQGGTPLTYQWLRNGTELIDGAQSFGIVSGATTPTVQITNPSVDATAVYVLRAINPCGATDSAPAIITMHEPTPVPATWTVVYLHPAWALSSTAYDLTDIEQVGSASIDVPIHGTVGRPVVWHGSAASAVDLTPAGSVGGTALACANGVQVGWWWWPYHCGSTGNPQTCYSRQAGMWNGTAGSHTNLQYSGWEYSTAYDIDGAMIVGSISRDDAVGNYYNQAVYKTSLASYWQSLHPSGVSKSGASAADNGHQYGWIHTPFPGPVQHAAMWTGTPDSFVDMNPPGAQRSSIAAAGDGQQVGSAHFADGSHAGLWADSPESFQSLNPPGQSATVNNCAGGLQVGAVASRATIWSGTPDSTFDLHAFLSTDFTGSSANSIHVDAGGVLRVVGSAYNAVAQRTEAILWIGQPAIPGDIVAPFGVVDVFDLLELLSNWGTGGPGASIAEPTNVVDVFDLLELLANWS